MSAIAGGTDGGKFVTDVTNASRTNFMELSTRTWHEGTLRLFGANTAMLPEIRSNAEVYGCSTEACFAWHICLAPCHSAGVVNAGCCIVLQRALMPIG